MLVGWRSLMLLLGCRNHHRWESWEGFVSDSDKSGHTCWLSASLHNSSSSISRIDRTYKTEFNILHCAPKNVHLFIFPITLSKINRFKKMIIGALNPEKIWHQQLVHLPTLPVHCATLPWEIQKVIFNSIIHTYFRLFVLRKKTVTPYPPHRKNVTTLPRKM